MNVTHITSSAFPVVDTFDKYFGRMPSVCPGLLGSGAGGWGMDTSTNENATLHVHWADGTNRSPPPVKAVSVNAMALLAGKATGKIPKLNCPLV